MRHTRTIAVLLTSLALAACAAKHARPIELPSEDPKRLSAATELWRQGDQARTAGDFEKAIDSYRQALELRDDLGGVWNNMGLALLARNQYMDRVWAADAYRRAADLMPRDAVPLENLAMIYAEQARYDDALEYYGQALERDPYARKALRGAAEAAARLGRSDEVTRDRVRRALMVEIDPTWREILERQRLRVEGDLAEKARVEKEGS